MNLTAFAAEIAEETGVKSLDVKSTLAAMFAKLSDMGSTAALHFMAKGLDRAGKGDRVPKGGKGDSAAATATATASRPTPPANGAVKKKRGRPRKNQSPAA